jgi:hypothetical protein
MSSQKQTPSIDFSRYMIRQEPEPVRVERMISGDKTYIVDDSWYVVKKNQKKDNKLSDDSSNESLNESSDTTQKNLKQPYTTI